MAFAKETRVETQARIEAALEDALAQSVTAETAPGRVAAVRHAVCPGGARLRPRLCLSVAAACGADAPELSLAAGCAVELIHCASLVHDDLPCFDNAETRRGLPSVHAAFGQPRAVLAGDALIVLAFETLARAGAAAPQRLAGLVRLLAQCTGMGGGIASGQAWESEARAPLALYHQQKTGALFVAAAMGGALSAGVDPGPWRAMGDRLGEAYQVADDLLDALSEADAGGKPGGQDSAHARPNAVLAYGLTGAVRRLERLVEEAALAVPSCEGAPALRELVRLQAARLVPKHAALSAA